MKYLFLLLTTITFAQVKGVVVDVNNNPIAYVNITVENQELGTTSEENGTFTLQTNLDNMLVFSALGFETKKVKANEVEKVVLVEKIIALNEVVILSPKFKKTYKIGQATKTRSSYHFGAFPSKFGKVFTKNELPEKNLFIKKIEVFTKSEIDSALFKIAVYNLDSLGYPNEVLHEKEIFATTNSGRKKVFIDVQNLKIQVPENGVFVCVENIIIEKNKYLKLLFNKNKSPFKSERYEPGFLIMHTEKENTFSLNFIKKKEWYKHKPKMISNAPEKFSNKIHEPAINLILSN